MIINNATGIGIIGQNRQNQGALSKIFEKLSTGKRINRASDDASMLSIARELEKQVRGFRQTEVNMDDALSALRISDGGASQITDMLQRQRELAIQANNGTNGQEQRDALNTEFQALSSEIDRISQSTQFNRQSLLDGQSDLSDGTGEITAGTGTAEADRINMPQADLRAETLNISNLDISNPSNISSALQGIDSALNQVNQTRTNAGAAYNRFEYSISNSVNQRINTAAALSQAEDLDYAEGTAEQARASILSQSNMMALQNFNNISRNNILGLLNS
ncbi:MAG: hypothetical protein HQK83_09005 [Fibrobacteria bacterium]|nr:hypothetical protein [Fibrobacteria bacterium]